MTTSTRTLTVAGLGAVPVTFTDAGSGRPVLLLHGGGGPVSVAGFGHLLSASGEARVITPVHPGFDAAPRPGRVVSIASLAAVYAELLHDLGLTGACVIGNSIGGWIAAELAVAQSAVTHNPVTHSAIADRRVSSVVLVNAAGLQTDAAPFVDFFALTLDQVADLSYFNPEAFRLDPATFSAERKAALAANRATLAVYGGTTMADASLLGRLSSISIPSLVVWGAADRI